MKLNSKVTGALAWTGLVVVLAVPSAEMIFGDSEPRANITSDTSQVKTPTTIQPVKTPVTVKPVVAPATGDAVQEYVESGKELPSYISDTPKVAVRPGTISVNPDGTITRPGPATTPPVTEVAVTEPFGAIDPTKVAPTPAPASQRPSARDLSIIREAVEPLILDENEVAAADEGIILPPADIVPADELEEWDSGSLADYLRRRGLLSEGGESADYDSDGFYLDEGPNNRDNRSRVRRYDDGEFLF